MSSWCDWLLYYFKKRPKAIDNTVIKKNDDINEFYDKNYYLGEFDDDRVEDDGPIWF
jgi:hypothetical protein